jgi:hypothetical protein
MIFGKELLLCVDRPREIFAVLPGPNIGVRGCNARLHFLARRVTDHPGPPARKSCRRASCGLSRGTGSRLAEARRAHRRPVQRNRTLGSSGSSVRAARLMTVPGMGPILSRAVVAASTIVRSPLRDAASAPGSDLCLGKSQPRTARFSERYRAAAIAICGLCSGRQLGSC